MTRLIFIWIFLFTSVQLSAQNWHTDYEKALKDADVKNLPIILVFQGSDWCAPCIKLDREIWQSSEFIKYAKDHYVLLKADFPKKKKHRLSKEQEENNKLLAEKYNPNGYFPLVVVLDKKGRVLGKTGYKKVSPSDYIKELNSFSVN